MTTNFRSDQFDAIDADAVNGVAVGTGAGQLVIRDGSGDAIADQTTNAFNTNAVNGYSVGPNPNNILARDGVGQLSLGEIVSGEWDVTGDMLISQTADLVFRDRVTSDFSIDRPPLSTDLDIRSPTGTVTLTANTAKLIGTSSTVINTSSNDLDITANGTIDLDGEVRFTSSIREEATAVSGAGSTLIDLSTTPVFTTTIGAAWTPIIANAPAGTSSFRIFITNGGSFPISWPASIKWAGGSPQTLSVADTDILTFLTVDGGTTWYGFGGPQVPTTAPPAQQLTINGVGGQPDNIFANYTTTIDATTFTGLDPLIPIELERTC